MKRHKLGGSKSRKLFSNTASKTHRLNSGVRVMRGGFRL